MNKFISNDARFRALVVVALVAASFRASSALATGPLINDVGNGAWIWGSSGERTTYIGPYCNLRAPIIQKIPEDFGSPSRSSGTTSNPNSDLWRKLDEVGTVIGADGKIYRYHYEKGIEPRRIIERRQIDGRTVNVERIVGETVLIRVLEPLGADAKRAEEERQAKATAQLPDPCAPAVASSETADASTSTPATSTAPANPANSSPTGAAGTTPTNADPSVAPTLGPNYGDASVSNGTPGSDGVVSVTVTTRDPGDPAAAKRTYTVYPDRRR